MNRCKWCNLNNKKYIEYHDKEYLTGLWFVIFDEAKKWLDIYFTGQNPSFIPKYKFENLTPFKKRVFDILNEISYGKVITYNDIVQKYV